MVHNSTILASKRDRAKIWDHFQLTRTSLIFQQPPVATENGEKKQLMISQHLGKTETVAVAATGPEGPAEARATAVPDPTHNNSHSTTSTREESDRLLQKSAPPHNDVK